MRKALELKFFAKKISSLENCDTGIVKVKKVSVQNQKNCLIKRSVITFSIKSIMHRNYRHLVPLGLHVL